MERFNIIDCGKYFTVTNVNGTYDNHAHVKTKRTAKALVNIMTKKQMPYSDYLRKSAIRITTDDKYKERILNKIEKDKSKQKYININKGVKGK